MAFTTDTEKVNSGGIDGFFGGQKDYKIFTPETIQDASYNNNVLKNQNRLAEVKGREAITAGPAAQAAGGVIDPTQQAQFRNQQMQLGNALMAQANGQGPSVAGSQLQQSTEMNLQAALAQAASQRGGNLGAAQYQLGNARANIQQQAAQQLAQTRIQEQMAARSQLGQVLDQGRGADIGLALNQAQLGQQNQQFNAGQSNQMAQFNTGAQVQQQAQNDAQIQQLMAMGYSMDQANYMAQIQQSQYQQGSVAQQYAASQGISSSNAAQGTQMLGAVAQAVGTAYGASDERLKKDVTEGDSHARDFLNALAAKHYSYKDEKWGEGPRMGIMAQDAEKSALGRSFVVDTKDGKMLDLNKAVSAALASMAYLNKRVNKLER